MFEVRHQIAVNLAAYAVVVLLVIVVLTWKRSRAAAIFAGIFAILFAYTGYRVSLGGWLISWPFFS